MLHGVMLSDVVSELVREQLSKIGFENIEKVMGLVCVGSVGAEKVYFVLVLLHMFRFLGLKH